MAVNGRGQRGHMHMAQVTPVGVLTLRQPHTLARVAGKAAVLDSRAEHLPQQPERILHCRYTSTFRCHGRNPRADRRCPYVGHRHVAPLRFNAATPTAAPRRHCLRQHVRLRRRPHRVDGGDGDLSGRRRNITARRELGGHLGIEPRLRGRLPFKNLAVLTARIVHIHCAPTLPLAMRGAVHRRGIAIGIAHCFRPTVLHASAPIAFRCHVCPPW
ncbi:MULTISPECIES: hypothetical protein [Mycobacterium]|uniref:hypothetical protein n=1 Tax=Mycobacterium sp. 20KCMC460 TaxID=2903536 RepID=UPI001EE19673|nr:MULTISPECIES: hypothetical protein [Mycobacterium]